MSSRPKREMRLRRIGKRNIHNSTCRSPMTAIVVRKGAVVATGVNKRGYRGSSIHAEMDALRQLRWQKNGAEGADLWLFRFGSHCMEAICAAGINKVYYYDWEGQLQCIKTHSANPEDHYTIDKWNERVQIGGGG